MNIAIIIIFAFFLLAISLGIRSSKGKDMTLEQWTVGGRSFGALFVFLLMAGEIYTTFTFLGASGWLIVKEHQPYMFLCTLSLSYVASYWLLPEIWKYANDHQLMSQSDFFVSKYKSPIFRCSGGDRWCDWIVPIIVLQLKGLGIIVSEASYGAISMTAAIWRSYWINDLCDDFGDTWFSLDIGY